MAVERCRRCRRTFRVLDDEIGQHDCPSCGWDGGPLSEEEEIKEEDEEEEE